MPPISTNDTSTTVEFVTQLIENAYKQNASDIHFEPGKNKFRIRFRIDGILRNIYTARNSLFLAIVSHIKVRANLDIAEKRLPQDGRIRVSLMNEKYIECRISSLPTLYGEKIVVRLLYADNNLLALDSLGMNHKQQELFKKNLMKPHGLIIITGPTGSGKSTTLYTGLQYCNTIERNICTIEDPIEITLENINQVNVNHKIGLDFKRVLKAILRQDPDVIMVGEIRDTETANLAIQAAATGHLVLTTLHTKNAAETIFRLQQMGIHRHNLSEALTLIIAQRLLRKRCLICHGNPHCCDACYQGYLGRTGVFEMLDVSDKIKLLLSQKTSLHQIIHTTKAVSLKNRALQHAKQGHTNHEEIFRVIG